MNIRELSLRNYRVFEELDLELPARVIGIFGPNGSGKSTLVEAILFALYGKARTGKNEIRTQGILTDGLVRLVFEHGGSEYEVRRTIRGKNSSTEAELFVGGRQLAIGVTDVDEEIRRLLRMDQHVFRASVFAEQKQLDAFSDVTAGKRKEMVLRLLGIRPVDDARTAARREGKSKTQSAAELTGAVPDLAALGESEKTAKQTLKELTARAKEAAAADKQAAAASKQAAKDFDEAEALRHRVEKVAVELEAKRGEILRVQTQQEDHEARATELDEALAALPGLEKEQTSLAGVEERLRNAVRLAERSEGLAAAAQRLAKVEALDPSEALASLERADAARGEATHVLTQARTEADRDARVVDEAAERLDRAADADPSAPCPTCGQELGAGFTAYVKHCKKEVADAKRALAEAKRVLTEAERAAKGTDRAFAKAEKAGLAARKALEDRERLSEAVDGLKKEVSGLLEPFGGKVPDVNAIEEQVARTRAISERIAVLIAERKQLERTRRDGANLAKQAKELAASIETLDTEMSTAAFDPKQHAGLRTAREEAAAASEEAHELERSLSAGVAEAQAVVSRIGGEITQAKATAERIENLRSEGRYIERVTLLLDGFRDHLVGRIGPELSREAEILFRELTGNEYDDLKIDEDSLSIKIADGDAYFDIERFSGSETDLANLALRVAISLHLSRVSGADVGMMVLDEVLGSLDAERTDQMVQVLGRLKDRFHQLFVITHAEQIKDQFPASIEVTKTGRRRSTAQLV